MSEQESRESKKVQTEGIEKGKKMKKELKERKLRISHETNMKFLKLV